MVRVDVDVRHCFWDSGLEDVEPALRDVCGEQSCSCPQAGFGGENCRPHFAAAAGDKQGVSIMAFVGFGVTVVDVVFHGVGEED